MQVGCGVIIHARGDGDCIMASRPNCCYFGARWASGGPNEASSTPRPVSYTHLTLPTTD